MTKSLFSNYTQLKPSLPLWFWQVLRVACLSLTLYIIYLLLYQPTLGLLIFWALLIPLLPLSFAVIPGLWRNICPMAFLNQLPRQFGFGMQLTISTWGRHLALLLSIFAFMAFVIMRAPLLNHSAVAVAVMLISVLLLAFIGGLFFKGRSGWCGTFCPLAPLQKVYGQAPLLMVRNGYCKTCVGCQKNCYDFNPCAAVFSDLNDDVAWSDKRKYFVAMLPGLIFGFFHAVSPEEKGNVEYYLNIFTFIFISIGIYHTAKNTLRLSDYQMTAFFGMFALAIFYWNGVPIVALGFETVFGFTVPSFLVISSQYFVIVICLLVIARGLFSEYTYKQLKQLSARASIGGSVDVLKTIISAQCHVQIKEQSSGKQFEVKAEQSLLDALESANLPIMSGCRMGMCGSDPIMITEGEDNLEPADENELATLRRLGLEGKARLACCCKPKANLTINLNVDQQVATQAEPLQQTDERDIIVIIGNGIAGTTTAERIRELNTHYRIILISQEAHHFYNRMGLEKVIHGRTAMQGLYLLKDDWYQRNDIDVWLNTQVLKIDRENKKIKLGTGEYQAYNKLVLANGGNSFVPPITGFDLAGCYGLRDANDALNIRAWVQQKQCKKAVVLGGGVLGVEAADALKQLGLEVTLIHKAVQLMERQLDLQSAVILKHFLHGSGINVITNTSIVEAMGNNHLQQIRLDNGEVLVADILLICTGIRANVTLANAAKLNINRGVIVNNKMQTSDEDIYCVGDAAELPGAVGGLWSVGSEQGKIAGSILAGQSAEYEVLSIPPLQLKVGGIDIKSFGTFNRDSNVISVTTGDTSKYQWAQLQLKEGQLTAGVFVNSAKAANAAISALKRQNTIFIKEDLENLLNDKQKNNAQALEEGIDFII